MKIGKKLKVAAFLATMAAVTYFAEGSDSPKPTQNDKAPKKEEAKELMQNQKWYNKRVRKADMLDFS